MHFWLPGGIFWVYFTGFAMLAACICIVTDKFVAEACLGLAILLVVFIAAIHIPGLMNEGTARMATESLLRDVSLTGGALTLVGIHIGKKTEQ